MRFLRSARAGLFLAFVLPAAGASFAAETPEDAAQKAAESWLKLVDGGKHAESWDAAAALFQAAVSREQWIQALGAVRPPLGELVSRRVKSRTFSKTLPGAPDGEYVVIQYESTFGKKAAAVETVTLVGADGAWRVGGYFIK